MRDYYTNLTVLYPFFKGNYNSKSSESAFCKLYYIPFLKGITIEHWQGLFIVLLYYIPFFKGNYNSIHQRNSHRYTVLYPFFKGNYNIIDRVEVQSVLYHIPFLKGITIHLFRFYLITNCIISLF